MWTRWKRSCRLALTLAASLLASSQSWLSHRGHGVAHKVAEPQFRTFLPPLFSLVSGPKLITNLLADIVVTVVLVLFFPVLDDEQLMKLVAMNIFLGRAEALLFHRNLHGRPPVVRISGYWSARILFFRSTVAASDSPSRQYHLPSMIIFPYST